MSDQVRFQAVFWLGNLVMKTGRVRDLRLHIGSGGDIEGALRWM